VARENVVNNQEQDITDAVESFLGIDELETTSNSSTKVVYRGRRCSCTVVKKLAVPPDSNPATITCKHGETLPKGELKNIVVT
jgi:hypothetical protein